MSKSRNPSFLDAVTGAISDAANASEAAVRKAFGNRSSSAAKSRHTAERADEPAARSTPLPRDPHERYEQAHWGKPPKKTYEFKSIRGVPDKLVEMGKLCEIQCIDDDGPFDVTFAKAGQRPILAFDTTDAERLYIALPEAITARVAEELIGDREWETLAEVAADVGGRQAEFPYPNIRVQCVGAVSHIVYFTEKGAWDVGDVEDGRSEYVHEFSEESGGPLPHLCVDRDGRLWLAGGNFTCPNQGITD